MNTMHNNGDWTILAENGESAINFTSFISMDYGSSGDVASYPLEEGGFVNYNKNQSPHEISVTLGLQGTEADFEYTLLKLGEYQRDAIKLSVLTPAALYGSLALKSHTYSRGESGSGMLEVNLSFTEVREIKSYSGNSVISRPQNPTSASKSNTGHIQPQHVSADILS